MGAVFVHAILATQHETHYDTAQTTISSIMHGAYVFFVEMQWDSSTQPQTQNH